MSDLDLEALLVEVASIPGVSGREKGVAAYIAGRLKAIGAEVHIDRLGNVYGALRSARSGPAVFLSAHMDTIGLVVRDVDEHGVIRALPVGGVSRRTLPAQEVWVHGRERLFGVVGTTPPHLTTADERKKIPQWEEFFVDTGLAAVEVRRLVRPGDWIEFAGPPLRLAGGRFAAAGLDNRSGVAAVLACGIRLAAVREELPVDVILHFTVQEELGLRGAAALDRAYSPGAVIVVDVGFGEMPEVKARDTVNLGKGPAIMSGPNVHKGLRRHLLKVAERRGIPVQHEHVAGFSGTDAWELQLAGRGIPSAVASIPLRYMHSTVETLDLADLKHTCDLLQAACLEADAEEVKGWTGGPVTASLK